MMLWVRRGRRIWIAIAVAVGMSGLSLAGAGGAMVAASSPGQGKPAVPGVGRGVYLGAWVNPEKGKSSSAEKEFQQLPAFDASAGRAMAILHLYVHWNTKAPIAALETISDTFHAIPLLDWHCGDTDANIVEGRDDRLIYAYAKVLKRYGKPVFLRWFWEMNDANHASCLGTTVPPIVGHCSASCATPAVAQLGSPSHYYVEAWQRIWAIFHGGLAVRGHKIDAGNVAFVWCPSVSNTDYTSYYPGNRYVDWIAADGYSHGRRSFTALFDGFYKWAQSTDRGAPLMIAETASGDSGSSARRSSLQQAYLTSVVSAVAGTMPAVEAFVYFDSMGSHGKWVLQPGPGLTAFQALGGQFTFGES
jgi:hypothetical protein